MGLGRARNVRKGNKIVQYIFKMIYFIAGKVFVKQNIVLVEKVSLIFPVEK